MKMFTKLKKRESLEVKDGSGVVVSMLKGGLIALCISLVGILIFAFLLKFLPIGDAAIRPINQVVKGASIFIGVFMALKKSKEMGLVKGLVIGLFYTIIAFVVFSILNNEFLFNKTLVNDFLFGGIIGAISGIISVNLKK